MTRSSKTGLTGISRRGSRGQIMPIALIGVLIASATLVVMYRTGNKVTEKSQVANAADAAAYSGAVWSARHLNFMAYTNRAMVANHVAVGHLVSYMSWVRYMANTLDFIEDYTFWIPYVGQYITEAQDLVLEYRDFTETEMEVAVPVIDAANAMYRVAQMEAWTSLSTGGLDDVMERTAQHYDNTIRLNDMGHAGELPEEIGAPIRAELAAQYVRLPSFIERYSAGDDEGRVNELISSSYHNENNMRRWIAGERGWSVTAPTQMHRVRKQGHTTHEQDDDSAEWEARDRVQFGRRRLTWRGLRWSSWELVGDDSMEGAEDGWTGVARASEFDDDYEGLPNYYNVAGDPRDVSLRITAFATMRQSDVGRAAPQGTTNLPMFGMTNSNQPMSAIAFAEAEFRRPSGLGFSELAGRREEYANLFNPFWEAHLTQFEMSFP